MVAEKSGLVLSCVRDEPYSHTTRNRNMNMGIDKQLLRNRSYPRTWKAKPAPRTRTTLPPNVENANALRSCTNLGATDVTNDVTS